MTPDVLREWKVASYPFRHIRGTVDVDDVAVERACAGDLRVPLTRDERAAAFLQLRARGLSLGQIAVRLGTTKRTVERWNAGRYPEARKVPDRG